MPSILERLDDLIRGSLHRFVDRALQRNSLVYFDQDVRDMESAIAHLEEATANMYAAARANERRLVVHQEDVEELEQRLERMIARGEEPTSERMMVTQAELDAKRDLVVETEVQIERQQGQYETLAKSMAETKVVSQTLIDNRPRLESLLALTRAYRSVERVELTLDALRGLGGDTDVAQVADSIYQRFHQAEARLEAIRAAEDLEMLAELEREELEDQLAARRQRLGLQPEEVVVEPEPMEEAPIPSAPDPEPAPEEPEPAPAPTTDPEPAPDESESPPAPATDLVPAADEPEPPPTPAAEPPPPQG
jgi:phage shock protein A